MDYIPKIYLYRRMAKAKCFIDDNFAEPIDISDIADEAFFSKYHFIREFKKIYGKPPHQYLKQVRIENAMLLLRSGSIVSEACFKVGFNSVSSFSALFKRRVGQSPSEYLNMHQQIQSHMLQSPLHFIPGCFAFKSQRAKSNFEEVAFA